MSKTAKLVTVFLTLMSLLVTPGCWDIRELQDRNFVMAAAIDAVDGDEISKDKQRQVETFAQNQGEKRYRLSLQVLKLTPAGAQGEGGPQASKTFIYSNTGTSMFEMVRDMLGQSSKSLFFEHLQVIIISEAAVKQQGLEPILDFFRRDAEMRWRIKVLITPGKARDILEFLPPTDESGGRYLVGIMNNHEKNIHLLGLRNDIGYTGQSLDNKYDVVLPKVELSEKVLRIGGVALFKGDKFIKYEDDYFTRGFKFLNGSERSAVIPVECPIHSGKPLVFEVINHYTKRKSSVNGDNVSFSVDILLRGNIGEVMCGESHNTTTADFLNKASEMFANEVRQNIDYTMKKMQELEIDPLHFRGLLQGEHPKEWVKLKNRWQEIYPTAPLKVSVNVAIRMVGEHQ